MIHFISSIVKKAKYIFESCVRKNPKASKDQLENSMIFEISNFIQQLTNKKPVVIPIILSK